MPLKLNYLLIPLFVLITASAASHFADVGMAWYKTINLPDWTPSNMLMVIVWTFVFVLASCSLLIIWNRHYSERNFQLIIGLFILNALLNVGWNILFFTQQQIGLAFFGAVLLIVNLSILIYFIWKFSPISATLLLPYSFWVTFATVLTLNVWLMN